MRPLAVFAFIALLMTAGTLYFVKKDGVEAPVVRILNPTNFKTPTALGKALAQRFYNELQMKNLFVLGTSNYVRTSEDIWRGFFAEATKLNVGFHNIIHLQGPQELAAVKSALQAGHRVAVLADSTTDVRKYFEAPEFKSFIIFLGPFAPDKSQIEKLPGNCEPKDEQSVACLSRKASSQYFRRQMSIDQFGAIMEKYNLNFGVLFVWEPL